MHSGSSATFGERSVYALVALLGLTMFSSYVIRTVLPYIARDLGLSTLWISRVLYVNFVALAAIAPIAGYLCDRYGYRSVITLSAIGFIALVPLYRLAHNAIELLALRLVHGAVIEILIASSMGLAAEISARGGAGFSVLRFFQGLGIAIGPIVAGILVLSSYTLALGVACIPLLLLLALLCLERIDQRRERRPSWRRALASLKLVLSPSIAKLLLMALSEAAPFIILLTYYSAYLVNVIVIPSYIYGAFLFLEAIGFSLGPSLREGIR